MTSLVDADSMLVMDVGEITTRAILFDVVEGRYRFLAVGTAPTTAGVPFHDISEGIHEAIRDLQEITGRSFLGADERLLMPSTADGAGVDTFAASLSVGPALKVIAVGLLEEVSLESSCRLAAATYSNIIETISLNNRRKTEANIDAIVRLRPDLIVVAGGAEGGATQAMLKLLEAVGLACYLLPEGQRPEILFAGNQALHDELKSSIGSLTGLSLAPNVRPTLEVEQLDAAQTALGPIVTRIRSRQIHGVKDLNDWAGGRLLPGASAFGRMIRYLSKSSNSLKGALGVDLGASAATVAAAFQGDLRLGVYPHFGLGRGLPGQIRLEDIVRWLRTSVADSVVREYIYNKALYPASVPATAEEQVIEEALARQCLYSALQTARTAFPPNAAGSGKGSLPWFEPILATGSVLTRAPSLAHSLLMLLDAIQPSGATIIMLDQNHLSQALGMAAEVNPVLAIHVLNSNTFLHLGTVISPVGEARPGTPVLRLKMTYEGGRETTVDVKEGTLEVLPLPAGQEAQLHLQPLHRYEVGMGKPGRSGRLKVIGGQLGVVIDARGRPLNLPADSGRRQELYKKWLWTLGS